MRILIVILIITMIQNPVFSQVKSVSEEIVIMNHNIQVPVEDAHSLHKANPNAKLEIIKNMNHVLKHLETSEDNMKSYYSENFPVSPVLIELITQFITH